MRHTSFLRRLPDAACDFVDDDVVVGGVAADKASQADDGIVFFRFCERTRRRRNLEGAGDADESNIFFIGSGADKAVEGALKKPFSDESIEAGHDERKALPSGVEFALNRGELCLQLRIDAPEFDFVLRDSVSPWWGKSTFR